MWIELEDMTIIKTDTIFNIDGTALEINWLPFAGCVVKTKKITKEDYVKIRAALLEIEE